MHAADPPVPDLQALLRTLRVWDTDLPAFDPATAPDAPLPLFLRWFAAAVDAGQPEPHTPSLATTDAEGRADVRTVMLHGADDTHGFRFASHSGSAKGRQLAARPYAALGFYWPVQGRQVRVRGPVRTAPADVAHRDLHARSTGALASALVGHQSQPLASYEELEHASDAAWERARREPDAMAPSWTVYDLAPDEVEFFQGDARRRHIRLKYRRVDGNWLRELLWP
ncbi:pyridoxine/pyridoxamine 5'-phosphate oxidase [Streptomyces beihaiensis]|uniref:Pyridoxal 5'-phosphate synthase n=1 Tax=Streptomyces beihaiensis TaxID=2984495 RepID=A0ABT3TQA1_9ACTN|nr:pyridoxal 5'-phosphate synthase [Streptomyces beihaiensis]MCX3059213.1 pyridoxal 5'-phosphate synthase [Streptomyces beihaiensis]